MRAMVSAALAAAATIVSVAAALEPGPVIQNLGPVLPTPVPSPEKADRLRLVTTFTLQNQPDGDSVISFEVTDFAASKAQNYRILANEVYTLVEPKLQHQAKRDAILEKIRDLERDLLEYVEMVGPPREREPVTQRGTGQRPY